MHSIHFVWPRWMTHWLANAKHDGYQGELEMLSFVFVMTLLVGAYFLAAIVLMAMIV